MLLQFVTEPTIGPKERRSIRSHVMKGKNAGKPRPARKRLIHRSVATPVCTKQDDSDDDKPLAKSTLSPSPLFYIELSPSSLPCDLGSVSERFIYQRTPPKSLTTAHNKLLNETTRNVVDIQSTLPTRVLHRAQPRTVRMDPIRV
jgi:hypothetical protein